MSVTAPSNRWAPRNRPQTRTWVVALVFVVLVAAGGAFSALVRYDLVGFGHLPRSAVFLSFLLLLLNAAWHKLTGHRRAHRLPGGRGQRPGQRIQVSRPAQ